MAERRGNGLQIRLHGFKSRLHLDDSDSPLGGAELFRAIGAVVARFLDTEEVTGSNPVSPTKQHRKSEPLTHRVEGLLLCREAPAAADQVSPRR